MKLARLRRGMSQDDVAHQAELDVKTVRKAEQGRRLDIRTIALIALTLHVDLLSLITLSNEPIETVESPHLQQAKTFVRFYDSGGVLHSDDCDDCRELCAPDFEFNCPADPQHVPFAGVWRGFDGFLQFLEIFHSVFERQRNSLIPDYLVADQRVVARYMDQVFFHGHEMPPFWVNLHFQFRDGLLVRVDDEFDQFNARRSFDELLAKLGQTLPLKKS